MSKQPRAGSAARTLAGSVCLVIATSAASAQNEGGGLPIRDRIDEAERLVPREPGEVEAFAPRQPETTDPVRPGLTQGLDWLGSIDDAWLEPTGAALLPERTFVNRVRGRVVRGPHDVLIFVPARVQELEPATSDATAEESEKDTGRGGAAAASHGLNRAVLLLPCGVLDRFAEYVLDGETQTEAILSGQVFQYDGRNYILPAALQRARPSWLGQPVTDDTTEGDAKPTPQAPTESEPGPDSQSSPTTPETVPPESIADDPDVEGLIAELERDPPFTQRAARPAEPSADRGESVERSVVFAEDGQYIAARRGRIVRADDGSWSFVGDTDRPIPDDPTEYTLLPCRTLQSLEATVLRAGDGTAGLLSGRVYRFRGRLYMLPRLFQAERRQGVDPLQ